MIYNIFGSEDSIDCDIMVFVESLPSIEECKQLCLEYESKLSFELAHLELHKDYNINLAVIKNGVIVDCHKGTPDECNNAILTTYRYHKQLHDCKIKNILTRDIKLKFARSIRELLSFLSRTEHREKVKAALKGDFQLKLDTLWDIDIGRLKDLGKNNQTLADYYKTVAFQVGQCMGLIQKVELYTKLDIIKWFPKFEDALYRNENLDRKHINDVKNLLVSTLSLCYGGEEIVEHTNWRNKSE